MTENALICPQCGAPMTLEEGRDYFHCSFCNSYVIPDPNKEGVVLLEKATDYKCPLCGTLLAEAVVNRIHILACPNCHGNLIPQPSLLPIITAARPIEAEPDHMNYPLDQTEFQRKLPCPRCHQPMISYEYGGGGSVVLQGCEPCALIWLDFGELTRIIYSVQQAQKQVPDKTEEREVDFDREDTRSISPFKIIWKL